MFCQKCGKEVEKNWKKCAFCGAELDSQGEIKDIGKHKKRKRLGIKKVILGCALLFALFMVFAVLGDDSDEVYNKNLELVQNGYLGNYNTVTVKEVLEYSADNSKWSGGEAKDKDIYIIEFKNDIYKIQFTTDIGNHTFKVSSMSITDIPETKPYEIKVYLDTIYEQYSEEYPEKGIAIDTSTDNDTLKGYPGPVKDVKQGKLFDIDILDCMGKSTGELGVMGVEVQEGEGNMYNDKDKVLSLLFDTEQKVSGALIEGPRNLAPCVAGVRIGDSKDNAIDTLETYGLVRQEDIGQNLSYISQDGGYSVLLQWSSSSGKIINMDCEVQEVSSPAEETFAEEVPVDDSSEYILPESNTRLIGEDEIANFTEEQRQLAINEIYARHGRLFDNPDIQEYFAQKSWYNGTVVPENFEEDILNEYEKKNLELLKGENNKATEDSSNDASINFVGITGDYQVGSDGDSGLISVFSIESGVIYLEMGTHECPGILRKIEAKIIDSNTAVGTWGSATFTLKWSDAGSFVITREGNCNDGLGMDELTNNLEYINWKYYQVS